MQIGKLQMRGGKDFVKYAKFSQPSLFIKTITLPISPRVTISVHHTHFLFFCISIFHFYFKVFDTCTVSFFLFLKFNPWKLFCKKKSQR